ncbi:MAG: sensor histidine kinase [Terriglobia bacterium]
MAALPNRAAPPPALSDAETLRALLDSAVTPIYALDREGRVLFANQAWAELAGVRTDALIGKTVAEMVDLLGGALAHPGAYRERVTVLVGNAETTCAAPVEYNTDGRRVFKEINQPLRRADGALLGRLLIYHDITREQALDRTKTEFISIASHELRTPMTSIKGSLDLLLGGFAGEVNQDTHELLVIAQSGCERLIRLINDILDLAKIEAGSIQLRLKTMSLLDSVQRSIRTIKSYADSLQVKLIIDCSAPPPDIVGDRDRYDQILTNLLGNAVKFSPTGGTVTVRLHSLADAMECRVIDAGPGIPPDQLPRIFEKFQQVEAPDRRKGGTGLGLTIARALVEEHGGKIWVESKTGQGSQFIFHVPLTRPAKLRSG